MAINKLANFRTLEPIITFLGLWQGGASSWFKRYYRYYQLFMHTTITFTFASLMILEVIYSESLDYAIDVLKYMLVEMAIISKVLNAWYYAQQTAELVNELEKSEIFELRTSAEEQMWQKSQKNFHKLTMIYMGTGLNSAFCALLAAALMGAKELPYALWLPYDWRDTYFWGIYCYECIAMPFTCSCNITIDLFQAYLLLHLTLCFRVISMRLERLENAGTEDAITTELLNNIKMHQRVKELALKCEQVISLGLLSQIMLTFLILCFIIYNMQNAHFSENPAHFLAMLQYALIISMEMFLPCYYGNELTVESEKLGIHLYSCDWTAMSAANRRLIYVYMESLKKPVVLCAGRFFEIGIPIFSKAMNNAYSVLALLLNVNDDEQH